MDEHKNENMEQDEVIEVLETNENDILDEGRSLPKKEEGNHVSMGISIGLALGVALGIAFDNLALGIGIGLCLGVAIGSGIKKK